MGDQNTPIRLSVVSERGKKRRNSSRQFCKKGKYIKKTKKNYDGTEALLDDPLVAYSAASSVPSRGEASRVHSVQAWLSSSSAKSGASRVRLGGVSAAMAAKRVLLLCGDYMEDYEVSIFSSSSSTSPPSPVHQSIDSPSTSIAVY